MIVLGGSCFLNKLFFLKKGYLALGWLFALRKGKGCFGSEQGLKAAFLLSKVRLIALQW